MHALARRSYVTVSLGVCVWLITSWIYLHLNQNTPGRSNIRENARITETANDKTVELVRQDYQQKCSIQRAKPHKASGQIVLDYIEQIQNCPCNVNTRGETNLLCATSETLLNFTERAPPFVPESVAPCVFVDDNHGHYSLADVNQDERSRAEMYMAQSPNRALYCVPSLFVLGVPKCGTTHLFQTLVQHQQILASQRKEMGFWSGGGLVFREAFKDDYNVSRYNLFAYMSLSRAVSHQIYTDIRRNQFLQRNNLHESITTTQPVSHSQILDGSPGNFKPELLSNILRFVPNMKAVLILRDPVEREFSGYRFLSQVEDKRSRNPWIQDQTADGFHRYVKHILNTSEPFLTARYHLLVENVLNILPRHSICFVRFEDYVKDPLEVIQSEVLPRFGLEPFNEQTKGNVTTVKRVNKSQKSYKMLNSTRILLENFFRASNRELSVILNDSKWNWGY